MTPQLTAVQRVSVLRRRLWRATRVHGVGGLGRILVERLTGYRTQRRSAAQEREFDRRHGVDTAGIVPLQALEIRSANRDLGVRYQGTHPEGFRALMAVIDPPAPTLTFIDLGAGKGRALLLASELPFRRIVGVEFAPDLCAVAQRNIARFRSPEQRCHEFELVCADVMEYELPDEPSLVYVYNSFEEPLTSAVLSRVRASVARSPRQLELVLVNRQVPRARLAETGWRFVTGSDYGELYTPA